MLVQVALDFARRHDILSIVVLDAFFSIGAVFELTNSVWSIALKQPYLTILTRANKSYVAYLEPLAPTSKPRGRSQKYGDKIKLKTVFETYQDQFLQAEWQLYGPRGDHLVSGSQPAVEADQGTSALYLCHHLSRPSYPDV